MTLISVLLVLLLVLLLTCVYGHGTSATTAVSRVGNVQLGKEDGDPYSARDACLMVVKCGRHKRALKAATSKSKLAQQKGIHLHEFEKKRLLPSYDTFDDYLELGECRWDAVCPLRVRVRVGKGVSSRSSRRRAPRLMPRSR